MRAPGALGRREGSMLVKCPQCGAEVRLANFAGSGRMTNYLCPSCQKIVRLDLLQDEVKNTSSASSFQKVERPLRILVADDSQVVQALARQVLEEGGYEVILCSDGMAALQAAENEHPDIAIIDLLMPRMTGFDVLREMKRNPRLKGIPVLILSGVYKENVVGFLHQLGAAGFIDKQSLGESLLFRVRAVLERTPTA